MNEHPIIFSGDMVRAILDDKKMQTRRVVKPQPPNDEIVGPGWFDPAVEDRDGYLRAGKPIFGIWDRHGVFGLKCPWLIGDHLWVREEFSFEHRFVTFKPGSVPRHGSDVLYWADNKVDRGEWTPPKPSIHMPRWASRITLEITNIRVERIKAISEWDAICEGIDYRCPACGYTHRDAHEQMDHRSCKEHPMPNVVMIFAGLWDSINEKRGFGWDANPWVWVIEFRRIKP